MLPNCWPFQWSPNVKIHFWMIFRKISGYWRESQSNPVEKFWEEIWSFSTCRNNITIIIFNKTFFSKIEILTLEKFFPENMIFQLFFQSPYIIMGRLLWFEGCHFRPKSRVFTCKNSYLKELIPLEKVENWSFCRKSCFDMFDRYAM